MKKKILLLILILFVTIILISMYTIDIPAPSNLIKEKYDLGL